MILFQTNMWDWICFSLLLLVFPSWSWFWFSSPTLLFTAILVVCSITTTEVVGFRGNSLGGSEDNIDRLEGLLDGSWSGGSDCVFRTDICTTFTEFVIEVNEEGAAPSDEFVWILLGDGFFSVLWLSKREKIYRKLKWGFEGKHYKSVALLGFWNCGC